MAIHRLIFFLLAIVSLVSPLVRSQVISPDLASNETVFNVPRVAEDAFDGTTTRLTEPALEIPTMCCAGGLPWPKATAAPSLRIAWNAAGLIVAVTVRHPHPSEADYLRHLFKGDSVEFFLSPRKGSRDRYMLIISPGLDPRYPSPRHCFFADPSEEGERDLSDLTFQCARSKTDDGYVMQVLLPWSNLHIDPRLGLEVALQVYVMEAEPNATPVVAMWHPGGESYIDPRSTQRICLADKGDAPILASAAVQDDLQHNTRIVRIVAPAIFAGKQFQLRTTDGSVVYASLSLQRTQACASLNLPIGQTCQVRIDRAAIPVAIVPATDDLTTTLTQKLKCKFAACLFAGPAFPRPFLEGAPHYRIAKVSYYDENLNAVESAAVPGRYGAVVDIADARGRITRRFRTLYRAADSTGPDELKALPASLLAGAADRIPLDASGHRDISFLKQTDALANPDTAALAACLLGARGETSQPGALTDFRSLDRQWWVNLKRKLNGWDQQFPHAFVCPMPLDAAPAPIVHVDTDAAAGVKSDCVEKVDRICRGIVGDVGEPVSICLVRHGVIFFHHAYGQSNGRPFTVDDAGDIKSATKPLAGALMMEVLDQKLLRADEPIDRVFPCFRGIAVKRPMTLRDLYDHLNGLTGDWGDQIHDTEEIVAGFYPAVDVGNYSYNEVGYALGGKIIEAVSGEAFPQFALRHLLMPMGMDHTRVANGGGHNATTSLDYAKFGQLLLNRGSYGPMRFFSKATFQQMLPPSDGTTLRGIGLMRMGWARYGFSADTFGHNAGNSSVLAIDPEHDLLVVIVSGGDRKDFEVRAEPFYRAVIAALK